MTNHEARNGGKDQSVMLLTWYRKEWNSIGNRQPPGTLKRLEKLEETHISRKVNWPQYGKWFVGREHGSRKNY